MVLKKCLLALRSAQGQLAILRALQANEPLVEGRALNAAVNPDAGAQRTVLTRTNFAHEADLQSPLAMIRRQTGFLC